MQDDSTMDEGTLARDLKLGNVKTVRIVERSPGTYEVNIQTTYLPDEALLMTQRGSPRTWRNLDRLLKYLRRLGMAVTVDWLLTPGENHEK